MKFFDSIRNALLSENNSLMGDFFSSDEGKKYIEQRTAVSRLLEESRPNQDFFMMLVFSGLITTLGLLVSNTSIVIGGMLIAPLLSSILALGLGIVTFSPYSIYRSAWAILRSVLIILLLSYFVTYTVGVDQLNNIEIMSRTRPSWSYVHIALLSGLAATYAWAKPKLSETLPGVAVSVALVPPLCVVGIGLAAGDLDITFGALDMFLVNFLGIVISAVFVFTILGFQEMRRFENRKIELEKKEKTA